MAYENAGGPPTVIPISRKKMNDLELDPAFTPSCAKPVPGQVAGCSEWFKCRLKEKNDLTPTSGSGPLYLGVREIIRDSATGKPFIRQTMWDCYRIPYRAEELTLNKGTLKVIARPGEMIKLRGSVPRDENIPGQGLVRFIDDVPIDTKVPEYKDPQSEDLMNTELAREVYEQDFAEAEAEFEKEMERAATAPVSGGHKKNPR